jgi:hypothetical protein
MTGYTSKRKVALDKLDDDDIQVYAQPEQPDHIVDANKMAQPAQDWSWVCNECGAKEYTSVISEGDIDNLACSGCGGDEFHKEAKPQRQPLTDEQIKKATWETSQKLLSFAAENGIAVKGIDEHVIAVGKAAIEAALRSKNT